MKNLIPEFEKPISNVAVSQSPSVRSRIRRISALSRHPHSFLFTLLLTLLTLHFTLFTFHSKAQPPQSFSYQAIIRDAGGNLVKEQSVGMQISILQGSETGTAVYRETYQKPTNVNGLVSLEIGNGTIVLGNFAEIDWADGPYFVKTETDPNGGSNYTIAGVSPLQSVPYALYAQYAASGEPGPQGPPGEDGQDAFLPDGFDPGAVPYWNGSEWILTDTHLFYDGQSLGIGTTNPDPSAILDLFSEDKGLLLPRLTTVQRDALPEPASGLMIFNSSENCLNYYTGSIWMQYCGSSFLNEQNLRAPLLGSSNGQIWGSGIVTDHEGNILVTGRFNQTAQLGSHELTADGQFDVYLVKYSPEGNVLWVRSANGTSDNTGRGIAVDENNNVVLTGHFTGTISFGNQNLTSAGGNDIFVAKYNANGDLQWVRAAGGSNNDSGYGVATDDQGNVFVTGRFNQSATFGTQTITSDGSNVFIVKYDSDGNVVWVNHSEGSGWNEAMGLAIDNQSNLFITGSYSNTIFFDDISLVNPSGGVANAFVVKYDPDGKALWAKSGSGENQIIGTSIAASPDGKVVATGYFSNDITFGTESLSNPDKFNAFTVKLDEAGNVEWIRKGAGTNSVIAQGIAVDTNGNILVTGFFIGTAGFGGQSIISAGERDKFTTKYDPNGNVIWVKRGGGSDNNTQGEDIATNMNGDVLATGFFTNSATFGTQSLTSSGGNNMFIVRYTPSGMVNTAVSDTGINGIVDFDNDPTNELITAFTFNEFTKTINIADAGGIRSVDLSPIASLWSTSGNSIYRSTGNTGIGTSAPRGRLNISLNSGVTSESIINDYPLLISFPTNTNTVETGIAFRISTGQNDISHTPGAAITHLRTGTGSTGHLLFKTKEESGEGPVVERMRVSSNGNVGIGTTEPGAGLQVERANSSIIPQLRIHNSTASSGFARLRFTNQAYEPYWDIAAGGNNNQLDFWQSGGTGSMLTLRGDAGNIGVGIRTVNPAYTLHVNGTAGKPGGGSWETASDARLKNNVNDLQSSLEKLLNLRGVSFYYNDPASIHELPGERIGMIAQEVAEVFPDWVSTDNEGFLRLTFRGFEALTVEALRELREEKDAEIARLREEKDREINQIKAEYSELQKRILDIELILLTLRERDASTKK